MKELPYIKDKDIANFIATNQHKYHFKTAKDMFLSKPINGYGLKCLERSVKPQFNVSVYSCTTHPHNSYLQLLAEAGLIGLIYLLLPLALII